MASIKLYKDSTTGLYVLGNRKSVPSGTCIVESNESDSYINIISTTGIPMESGNVSDFIREDGSSYELLIDILSELSDFFVKAPAGGGGDIQLSTSLNETATGKAADATLIKYLNDNKYPRIQNGTGFVSSAKTLETLVGVGFSLNYANLIYASLSGASLYYANLNSADLAGADLSGASLSGASLYYANLSGANLENANFNNANLNSANLSDANGLNSDINVALENVNKNPNGDGLSWTVTWTDGLSYSCNPLTGLFTIQ